MKHPLKLYRLPVAVVLFGLACLAFRFGLYAVALDEKNLLRSHPLAYLLWAAAALGAALIVATVWKLEGSARYEDNFAASPAAAFGSFLLAGGIGLTVFTGEAPMSGLPGQAWLVLGLLSLPMLVWAGLCRLRGKAPFFLTHGAPSLFLLLHIINRYQSWCANPQLNDYVFDLFALMTLAFFLYYTAAFAANCGNRRMQLGFGLLALLFGIGALSGGEAPFLYLGGIAFALTNLCFLLPRPKEEETDYDPS